MRPCTVALPLCLWFLLTLTVSTLNSNMLYFSHINSA